MRLQALFRVGAKLVVTSGFLSIALAVAGIQAAWTDWIFMILFVGGVVDMGIAASYDLRDRMRGDDGESRLAVEVDGNGFHFWFGDRAPENRREYLEERDSRPSGRLAEGAFRDMTYPMGMWARTPYYAPYYGQGFSHRALARGPETQGDVFGPTWPSEKRLLPLSWQGQGIEFPEPPAYSGRNRYGLPQPPFPIHFKTIDASETVEQGVRMEHSAMETHSDPHGDPHGDCPVCVAWRAEHGW